MKLFAKGLIAAALIAGFAGAATAQQLKPEDTLKLRQGLMMATKVQFGALGAYAQGKGDLPADALARAENLVALAKMSPAGWGKGTEGIKGSETKPEAFTSPDFAKGMDMFTAEAIKLVDAAKSGNADAIKAQAGAVGKTCKGCHDNFKKD